jgi:diguanylate cyclase (GGDEF)-like protein
MRNHGFRLYLATAAIVIAGYQLIPENPWWKAAWQVAIGYGAAVTILVQAARQPPGGRLPWRCFALGLFGNASGIAVLCYVNTVMHLDTEPTLADPLFLTLYPACGLALVLLIRAREGRRDWAAMVDTTTITTGLGLLAWVYVIQAAAYGGEVSLLGRIVEVAYPVGDLVLIAMLIRLVRGGGARGGAFWYMISSLGAFLAGDTFWAVAGRLNFDPSPIRIAGRAVDMVFLAAYVLLGASALHPSARELTTRGKLAAPRLSGTMLAMLTAASLIAPAILAIQVASGRVVDGVPIAIGSTTLFLLVVTRMAQLLRHIERQAATVRQLSRQDDLTGLPNRRAWNDELPRALERTRRDGVPVTIALLDLDHFKRFNDSYGHLTGDRLLKEASAAWLSVLRQTDTLARYGGEEFIALLPGSDTAEAMEVMRRVLSATPLGQTFSAGVATWDGSETSDQLIGRADAALYQAKAAGRGRIEEAARKQTYRDIGVTP